MRHRAGCQHGPGSVRGLALAWAGASALALASPPAAAQAPATPAAPSVALAGSMGADKALLVIDGQTVLLALGASRQGVTLRSLRDGQAEIEVAGQRQWLVLGATPTRLAGPGPAPASSSRIVLPMGPGGHFSGQGQINGRTVQFMVDSGATTVALSQAEARRIGLDWQRGQPAMTVTANGPVPAHAVVLSSVRLGGVELANVAALVLPFEMPVVLLGNSFLGRFTMRQDADLLQLDKKP